MNYICESCGSDLKYYDKVSRMVRTKNRKVSIITVKRFKCPVCNCIHRNLPNNIFPYKQYDARIITGVIEGKITSDMIDYEDYPCEMTMTRWRTLTSISFLRTSAVAFAWFILASEFSFNKDLTDESFANPILSAISFKL